MSSAKKHSKYYAQRWLAVVLAESSRAAVKRTEARAWCLGWLCGILGRITVMDHSLRQELDSLEQQLNIDPD